MSRPKIGSVTRSRSARTGRGVIQSRTVSQAAADTSPADEQRDEERDRDQDPPGSGVRSGMSPASKVMDLAACRIGRRDRRRTASATRSRRLSAAWAASLIRSTSERSDPRAVRRPAAASAGRRATGSPSRTTAASSEGPGEQAERARSAGSRRRQSKPTLVNHRASVHRSIPTLNSRRRRAEDRDDEEPRGRTRRPARAATPGPVVWDRPAAVAGPDGRAGDGVGRVRARASVSCLGRPVSRRRRPSSHPSWRRSASVDRRRDRSIRSSSPSCDSTRPMATAGSGSSPRAGASRRRSSSRKSSNRSRI